MGQLNSGIATKSCSYNFAQNGAVGSGIYSFAGISMKPGEAILDVRATRNLNLTSGSGSGTTFSLGWGNSTSPTFQPSFFIPMFSDTLNNINGFAWNFWQSQTTNASFKIPFNWRIPAAMDTTLNLWFTSSAALLTGEVEFVITFLLTKF